jgi:hypothetical protein
MRRAIQRCPVQLEGQLSRLIPSETKLLKDLEAENARLKKMCANLSLVHDALKDAFENKP